MRFLISILAGLRKGLCGILDAAAWIEAQIMSMLPGADARRHEAAQTAQAAGAIEQAFDARRADDRRADNAAAVRTAATVRERALYLSAGREPPASTISAAHAAWVDALPASDRLLAASAPPERLAGHLSGSDPIPTLPPAHLTSPEAIASWRDSPASLMPPGSPDARIRSAAAALGKRLHEAQERERGEAHPTAPRMRVA
jgi:hypothetical protein